MLGVVALAVAGSYSKFSDNCTLLEFALGKHFFQVVVDGLGFYVVGSAYHLLRDPDALVGIHRLDTPLAAGGDDGQVFSCRRTDEGAVLFVAGLGALRSVMVYATVT